MIAAGEPAPGFTLRDQDGESVSLSDFRGEKVLLVFYPLDFSPVCSDQLALLLFGQAHEFVSIGLKKAVHPSGSRLLEASTDTLGFLDIATHLSDQLLGPREAPLPP